MSQTMYQVIAEGAYATVASPYGMTRQFLLKGAVIPGDAPEIEHLVAAGLVAKVSGEDETGINALGANESDQGAAGSVVASGPTVTTQTAEPTAEDKAEAAREAARAKLPADGSAPHPNAGEVVWVEYAVKQGTDRTEAEKAGKAALVDLYKK